MSTLPSFTRNRPVGPAEGQALSATDQSAPPPQIDTPLDDRADELRARTPQPVTLPPLTKRR